MADVSFDSLQAGPAALYDGVSWSNGCEKAQFAPALQPGKYNVNSLHTAARHAVPLSIPRWSVESSSSPQENGEELEREDRTYLSWSCRNGILDVALQDVRARKLLKPVHLPAY